MRLGVRGRLFGVSLLIIAIVGVGSLAYLEPALAKWLRGRIQDNLVDLAQTARERVAATADLERPGVADALADQLGAAARARVTLMAADGRVLGDSAVAAADVGGMESHADRPEVRTASTGAVGVATRFSRTLGEEMLYVAIPWRPGHHHGVIRLAVPLSEVSDSVRRLRIVLLVGALVGLGLAVFMSALASTLASRSLRALVETARAVAAGDGVRRIRHPASDELGRLAGSFNRVASELDATVAELGAERDRLQAILDSVGDALVALDAEHRVTRVNRAALTMLGLERPPVGRLLAEVVRVPALTELVGARGQDGAEAEIELLRGVPRTVLARAAPIGDSGGSVLVLRDVSERRRLERVRRDFVANVSHELRTPVSVIRATAEALADGAAADPERGPAFLAAILRASDRLARLTSDLLDLARIESGGRTLAMAQLAVRPIVDRVLEDLRPLADERGVSVTDAVPGEAQVLADSAALEQVLANLLENAVKYTPEGGHVSVRWCAHPDGERIEVVDDGPGVSPKYRERIFERFYRVDKGRSRDQGGTGLGLSIVRNLVETMGGRAGYEPAPGGGSLFWVRLASGRPSDGAAPVRAR